jgi:hypothetical protein
VSTTRHVTPATANLAFYLILTSTLPKFRRRHGLSDAYTLGSSNFDFPTKFVAFSTKAKIYICKLKLRINRLGAVFDTNYIIIFKFFENLNPKKKLKNKLGEGKVVESSKIFYLLK